MKTYQLIGLTGFLILLICSFLPLAYLDESTITIAPIFDNLDLAKSMWVWQDVAAFAITFWITLLLCVYLLIKKYKPGYLISASLNFAVLIFIYFSVWLSSLKVEEYGDAQFNLGYTWSFFIGGYVLLFYSGLKIKKS